MCVSEKEMGEGERRKERGERQIPDWVVADNSTRKKESFTCVPENFFKAEWGPQNKV